MIRFEEAKVFEEIGSGEYQSKHNNKMSIIAKQNNKMVLPTEFNTQV